MNVSVIIPTLNEESCLAATVASLRRQNPREILVVDGGSTDSTRACARGADLFVESPRGRAAQMNAGAVRATGEILLFLHADCTLADGALREVERLLRRRSVAAGCFRMRVDADGWLYRLIDACATARVGLTGLAYGDQGLFLRRSVFDRAGGFPAVRFLEDVLLSQRLGRMGRMVVAQSCITVAPRRWQKKGLVRQTLRNWILIASAALGVSPDRLASYYPVVR